MPTLPSPHSYHNHSTWSDGTASVREMAIAASRSGLVDFGISDHYVLVPDEQPAASDWTMPLDRLGDYVADVQAAIDEGHAVLLGIEADYFPETWRTLASRLSGIPFDYVIGSVHYADGFPIDASASNWTPLSQEQIDEIYRVYWVRVREMAECGLYDFVGHFDLPKKFGCRPATDLSPERNAALDAIAAAGLALELNTAGWDKPCAECYPSPDLLADVRRREIPVLISADAHAPRAVAAHYQRAADLLWQLGFRDTVRFRQRERLTVPLAK